MSELSPQAQAVYDAATTAAIRDNADWPVTIAAALRSAVAEVRTDPELKRHHAATISEMLVLDKLVAIADELENLQ